MLLTLTTTHSPATDLGDLLRKNPARPQSFSLSFGKAHVFYPEATAERCTVALLVEVDPVGLVRNRRGPSGEGGALEQYVNDRPYAASSFLRSSPRYVILKRNSFPFRRSRHTPSRASRFCRRRTKRQPYQHNSSTTPCSTSPT